MSPRNTVASTSLRDGHNSDDGWLGTIVAGIAVQDRVGHESPLRSAHVSRESSIRPDGGAVAKEIAILLRESGQAQNRQTVRRVEATDISDEMLLRHVACGDRSAMDMLFKRYRQRVFRFIFRLVHDHDLAQDVSSQVFLDVWRFAHRFEYRSRVSTWLLSIAKFKAFNAMRRKIHQDLDATDLLDAVDTSDTPEVKLSRKEVSSVLRACLEELSPAHRQMLDLFYYHDCSIAEVSEKIGIPKATVKSRLFYARKHLARVLANAGFSADSVRPCRQ